MKNLCSCQCRKSQVLVSGEPILRFNCHCKICQKVYGKPFADIVVVQSKQVSKPLDLSIQFTKHRLPPSVNRGICSYCQNPVIALLPLAPFFGLAFVPAENFPKGFQLPEPKFHSFYNSRVVDIDDCVPKINGYLGSQWAVASHFLSALRN
ncbi:MAG: hypothetical protein ACJAS1_000790 [Oleiphilaceae bacterium]